VLYLEFLLALNGLLKPIALAESVQHATLVAGLIPNGLFMSIALAYALAAVRWPSGHRPFRSLLRRTPDLHCAPEPTAIRPGDAVHQAHGVI
jgi:hypothetical protein